MVMAPVVARRPRREGSVPLAGRPRARPREPQELQPDEVAPREMWQTRGKTRRTNTKSSRASLDASGCCCASWDAQSTVLCSCSALIGSVGVAGPGPHQRRHMSFPKLYPPSVTASHEAPNDFANGSQLGYKTRVCYRSGRFMPCIDRRTAANKWNTFLPIFCCPLENTGCERSEIRAVHALYARHTCSGCRRGVLAVRTML